MRGIMARMRRPVRRSALYAERIVSQNLIVVVSTLLAGALGFATQALLSHRLPPAGYGAMFTALIMLRVIWLPANALMLVRPARRARPS